MWNKIVKRFYKAPLRGLELDNHTNPIRGLIVSASNGVNLKQKPRFFSRRRPPQADGGLKREAGSFDWDVFGRYLAVSQFGLKILKFWARFSDKWSKYRYINDSGRQRDGRNDP